MGRIKTRIAKGVLGGAIMLLVVAGGALNGGASAKTLGKIKVSGDGLSAANTFGIKHNSSYHYAQCPNGTWIKNWASCDYGCGPVALAIARAYVKGSGVSPKTLFKSAPLSKLNNKNGTSDSDFKYYAKKVGLKVKKVSSAKQMLYELYKGHAIAAHVNHHWVAITQAYGAVKRSSKSTSWGSSKNKYKIINVYVVDPGNRSYRGIMITAQQFLSHYTKIKALFSVY